MEKRAEPAAPKRRLRTALGRALLLVGGLLVGLVAAELALRVLGIGFPRPYYPDPYCGTILAPGFKGYWLKEGRSYIEVNSAGFRDREHAVEKPPRTVRIAVLGDSFVEAPHVAFEDSLTARLESELQRRAPFPGYDVEVLNFGMSGHGTGQELLTLRHHVWRFEPDLVVLAFFPGNDMADNVPELATYKVKPFFKLEEERLVLDDSFRRHPDYLKAQRQSTRWKVRLINASRVLQVIAEFRDTRRRPREPAIPDDGPSVEEMAFVEPDRPLWKYAWALTERLLGELNREVHSRQAQFLLVTLTTGVQVHPDASLRQACRQRLKVDDLRYYERRLQSLGEREAFPVVCLSGPMRRYAEENQVYLHGFDSNLGEGHWNQQGHRLGAELIADAICKLFVVEGSSLRRVGSKE